jgi:hypothetical protein
LTRGWAFLFPVVNQKGAKPPVKHGATGLGLAKSDPASANTGDAAHARYWTGNLNGFLAKSRHSGSDPETDIAAERFAPSSRPLLSLPTMPH